MLPWELAHELISVPDLEALNVWSYDVLCKVVLLCCGDWRLGNAYAALVDLELFVAGPDLDLVIENTIS